MKTRRQAQGFRVILAGMVVGLALPAWGDAGEGVGEGGQDEQWGRRMFEKAHGSEGMAGFTEESDQAARAQEATETDLQEQAIRPYLPEADRMDLPAVSSGSGKADEMAEGAEYLRGWEEGDRDDDVMGVPEPSTLAMLAAAVLATVVGRRRRA